MDSASVPAGFPVCPMCDLPVFDPSGSHRPGACLTELRFHLRAQRQVAQRSYERADRLLDEARQRLRADPYGVIRETLTEDQQRALVANLARALGLVVTVEKPQPRNPFFAWKGGPI